MDLALLHEYIWICPECGGTAGIQLIERAERISTLLSINGYGNLEVDEEESYWDYGGEQDFECLDCQFLIARSSHELYTILREKGMLVGEENA